MNKERQGRQPLQEQKSGIRIPSGNAAEEVSAEKETRERSKGRKSVFRIINIYI